MPGGGSRMESSSRTPPLPRRKIPESKSEQRARKQSPRLLSPRCSSEGRPARRSPRDGVSPRRLFFPSETLETVLANDLNNSEPLHKVGEAAVPVGCQTLPKLHTVEIFTPVDTISGCEPDPSASEQTAIQPCSSTPSSITEASVIPPLARTSPRGKGLTPMDDRKKTLQFLDRKRLQFSVQDDLLSLNVDKRKEMKKRKCTFIGGMKLKRGKLGKRKLESSRDEKHKCKIPLKFSKLKKAIAKCNVAKAKRVRPFKERLNAFQTLCVKDNVGGHLEGKNIPKENAKKKRGRPFKQKLNQNIRCNYILGQEDEGALEKRRAPSSERIVPNGESSVDKELDDSIQSDFDVKSKAELIPKSVEAFYGKICPNVNGTVQNKDFKAKRARKTQTRWKEKGMYTTLLQLKQSTNLIPNHCHQLSAVKLEHKVLETFYEDKDHDHEKESFDNIHHRAVKRAKEEGSRCSEATSENKTPFVDKSIQNGESETDQFMQEGEMLCNSLLQQKKRLKQNNPLKRSLSGSRKHGLVPHAGQLDKVINQKDNANSKVDNILSFKFPTKSIETFYGTVSKRTRSKPHIDWSILRKKVLESEPKSEHEQLPAKIENYSPSLPDTKPCSHVASFPPLTSKYLPSEDDKGFRSRSLSPKKKSPLTISPLRSRSTSPKKKHPLNKRSSVNPYPIFYVISGAPVPPPPKISLPKGYTWEIERVKTESDKAAEKAKKEGQLEELLLKSKSDKNLGSKENVDDKRTRRIRDSPRMNYCELVEPCQPVQHSNEEALPDHITENSLQPGSQHSDAHSFGPLKKSQGLLCPSKKDIQIVSKMAKVEGKYNEPLVTSKLYERLTLQEDEDELKPRKKRESQRNKCGELFEPGCKPRLLSSGEAQSDLATDNTISNGSPHSKTNPSFPKTKYQEHNVPRKTAKRKIIQKANKKAMLKGKVQKTSLTSKTCRNLTLQEDENVLGPRKIRNSGRKNYCELLEPTSLWPAKVEDITSPVTSNILLSGSQNSNACLISSKKRRQTLPSPEKKATKMNGKQLSRKGMEEVQAEKLLLKSKTKKDHIKRVKTVQGNEDKPRPRRGSDSPRKNYCELVEPGHAAVLHSSCETFPVPFTDKSLKSRSSNSSNNSRVREKKGKLVCHKKVSSTKPDPVNPVNPCMCIYLFPPVPDCPCNRFSIPPPSSTSNLISSPGKKNTKTTPSSPSKCHALNDTCQSSSSRSVKKKPNKISQSSPSKGIGSKKKQTKTAPSLDTSGFTSCSEILKKKTTADLTLLPKYIDLHDSGLSSSSRKGKKKETTSSSPSTDLGLNDSGLGSVTKSSQKKKLKNPNLSQSKNLGLNGFGSPKKRKQNPRSSPLKYLGLNGSILSSDSTSFKQKSILLSKSDVCNGCKQDSCYISPGTKQTKVHPNMASANISLNGSGIGSCSTSPEKKLVNGIPIPPPPEKCLKKGYAWELYLVQTESITADQKTLKDIQAKEAFLKSKPNENLTLQEDEDEQRPRRSRDSPRKNYCELEQEDEIERILAVSRLTWNPCKVVQPNQLQEKAGVGLSNLAITRLPQRDDKGIPPSPDGLQWNADHTVNTQGVYCYCGGPGCWYNRMVSCARCRQWFHERCLAPRPMAMPITPGDPAWLFVCSDCNSGKECLKKMELTWLELVHLIMFDLTLKTERKFHHLEIDLLPFFDSSWNNFQLNKHFTSLTAEERNKRIKEQLFYERCFENGSESGQDRNLWGLRRSVPPPGSRYQVPDVGIVQERTVLDEVTILEPVNISAANSSVILSKLNIVYKKYRPKVNKPVKEVVKHAKLYGLLNSSHVISETKHLNGKKITANGKLKFPNDAVVKTKHITHKATLKVPTELLNLNGLKSQADPSCQTTPSEVPRPETPELKLLPYEISKLLHKKGYPKVAMKFASVIPPKKNVVQELIQTKENKKNKKKIKSGDIISKNVLDCLIPKQHSYRGAQNPFRLGSAEVQRAAGNLQFHRKLNVDEQTTIRSRIRKSQYCLRIHESKKLLKPEHDSHVPCHGPEVMAQLAGQVVNPGGEIRLIMLCQQG